VAAPQAKTGKNGFATAAERAENENKRKN